MHKSSGKWFTMLQVLNYEGSTHPAYLCILPDVPLTDEHTCVVDALSKAKLEDLGLQPPLQEILHFQAQNVIELHLALIQHSNTHQTPKQGIT